MGTEARIRKIIYGYAESPNASLSTTKSTKDTKRDAQLIYSTLVIFVFFVVRSRQDAYCLNLPDNSEIILTATSG